MTKLDGSVQGGWERVADTFYSNFDDGNDLGAACCVYIDGQCVVDLWGGIADRATGALWDRETVVAVASTTKGATALCAHLLMERGHLDLDTPVVHYWPEFGAMGKESTLVRWLLTHQAGLPVVDAALTFDEACRWEPVIRSLEKQKPLWTPGTEHLYHAQTYGFLVGELVRRIADQSIGTFFAKEIAEPLGLSAWIGLPEAAESRLARVEQTPFPYNTTEDLAAAFGDAMGIDPAIADALVRTLWAPSSLLINASTMGGVINEVTVASRAFRAAEFPGANMFADARSIARMYAAMVSEVDKIRLLRPDTVTAMTAPQTNRSRMHGVPPNLISASSNLFNMSSGFWRSTPPAMPMLGSKSFGHPGSGGSLGAADPEARIGFGYVTNLWSADLIDPRAIGLADAVRKCVA